MDHSYSTDCRDTYQSKDHSYFRYGRKADPVIHPRTLYDVDPDSGRRDHSYFKLTPLALKIVRRDSDAGLDHTYGSRHRKPLLDTKQHGNVQPQTSASEMWPEMCTCIKHDATVEEAVGDMNWVDPVEMEKEIAQQIVKDHTYTYSKKKMARLEELATVVTTSS